MTMEPKYVETVNKRYSYFFLLLKAQESTTHTPQIKLTYVPVKVPDIPMFFIKGKNK